MWIAIFNFFGGYNIVCMPVHRGRDSIGAFYQWGRQKKYYYRAGNERSRLLALKKAEKQARAIYSSGYRPKMK